MNHGRFLIEGLPLFWAGFVSAISFMEAWLKFKVEGVTLPIGLRIGKKVFTAMNRVEWVLFILFTLSWICQFNLGFDVITLLPLLILIILVTQTFYLLPQLDRRAKLIIEGKGIEKSHLHILYVIVEFIKICILLSMSFYLTQNNSIPNSVS